MCPPKAPRRLNEDKTQFPYGAHLEMRPLRGSTMRFLSDMHLVLMDRPETSIRSIRYSQYFPFFTGKDILDFNEQIPIILRELIYRSNDDSPEVLKAAHAAFSALSKNVPAEELVNHIEFIRNLIASMVSDARRRKGGVGDGMYSTQLVSVITYVSHACLIRIDLFRRVPSSRL
jgi:hypothetical protein